MDCEHKLKVLEQEIESLKEENRLLKEKLSSSEKKQLQKSVDESRTQYKIIVGNAGIHQREAALQFARSFDEMDDETATKILELLSKKEDNNS